MLSDRMSQLKCVINQNHLVYQKSARNVWASRIVNQHNKFSQITVCRTIFVVSRSRSCTCITFHVSITKLKQIRELLNNRCRCIIVATCEFVSRTYSHKVLFPVKQKKMDRYLINTFTILTVSPAIYYGVYLLLANRGVIRLHITSERTAYYTSIIDTERRTKQRIITTRVYWT